jgi:hypothetical protein
MIKKITGRMGPPETALDVLDCLTHQLLDQ